jgi:hypothetical protein
MVSVRLPRRAADPDRYYGGLIPMMQISFPTVRMIRFLTILLSLILIGCSQDLSASGKGTGTPTLPQVNAPPPWYVSDSTCQLTETSAQSRGDPHAFDGAGNSTGLLPQGQVTCLLQVQVCGDMITKQKVVNTNAGEKCPDSLHFSRAPVMKVCCAKWDEAKRTKMPCDPMVDADCDGVVNDADEYLLDFSRQ